ncbi:MAG: hypothetical protein GKR89_34390 [Candidatus Latescibacteria bacterium]|nr:hypothetical protein [Candidatus Latescibacterota bacterium]
MLADSYLTRGITALAKAGSTKSMVGHPGAAVVAAYFFSREHQLDKRALAGLKGAVDTIIADGGKTWAPTLDDQGALFSPFPKEQADEALLLDIAAALEGKITRLRESGHCTIFAALALRGLRHKPDLITPSIVAGICNLISLFNDNPGQGYYGAEKGWLRGLPVDPAQHLSPYQTLEDVVDTAFGELLGHDKIKRKGYGSHLHLITHTGALIDLAEMGYTDLAQQGFEAHQTHIMLLRSLPPDLDAEGNSQRIQHRDLDPLTHAYWDVFQTDENRIRDHECKVNYAFFRIINYVKDRALRDQCMEQLGYLN